MMVVACVCRIEQEGERGTGEREDSPPMTGTLARAGQA